MAGQITVSRASGAAEAERFDVVRGTVVLPSLGAWTADFSLVGSLRLLGQALVRIGDGLALKGTVVTSKVHEGSSRLRLVAGADGLRKVAVARHYTQPTVRHVLQDLARDAGETISATSQADVLGQSIGAWTTLAMMTGIMLHQLVLQVPGARWRYLPDGSIWVGKETWPDSGFDDDTAREIDEDVQGRSVLVALDQPTLMPGTTILGNRADIVIHSIAPDGIRTRVFTVPA